MTSIKMPGFLHEAIADTAREHFDGNNSKLIRHAVASVVLENVIRRQGRNSPLAVDLQLLMDVSENDNLYDY
jgi:hypothetical protein